MDNNLSLMLFLAVLPVVLILIFVYNKDKTKEPLGLLMKLFGLGILSCFLVLAISAGMEKIFPFMRGNIDDKSFLDTLLYSFIGVALVEEFCKWLMLYFKGYKNDEFDELYDILVYSVFVSLGFAFFENILYVLGNQQLSVALLRAVSAVPGHACDAVFMGYYLNLAKQFYYKDRKELEKKYIIYSILVPALLHGIYDFCLMSGYTILAVTFVFFVIFLYSISIVKLKELSESNKKIKFKNKFCGTCGAKIEGEFCRVCGSRQE